MIRLFNRSISLRSMVLRITETLLIFLALLLAYWSGKGFRWDLVTALPVGEIGVVVILTMCCLDLYEPRVTVHETRSLFRIIQAMGLTMLVVALLAGATRTEVDSLTVAFGMLLVTTALIASRWLFAEIVRAPALSEPAVVWGSGALAADIIGELRSRPDIGVRIIGIVGNGTAEKSIAGVPYLGGGERIWDLVESGSVRRIIIAIGERRGCLPVEELMALKAAGVAFEDGAELYEDLTGRVWLGGFSTSMLLFSRRSRFSRAAALLYRSLSTLFALIALIIAAPVMLLLVLLIRLDSKGPAVFRQTRIGENGRPFTLFKFRSMKTGSEYDVGLAPATRDDPRCTRLGKWIRRFRLDELPQLFNIVKGDMCFVGPRPFVLDQEEVLVREIPHYRQRWVVRPGATGWAQVNRGYCSSVEDNAEKLAYDLFYIKNRSLALDVETLFRTFKIILLGRGAR